MKPLKPEVREKVPDLVRAQSKVQKIYRRIRILEQTILRIEHDGGHGWVAELSSTNLKLEKATAELRDAVSFLNTVARYLQGE